MNIVFAVFVGWAMLLTGLKFGRASSMLYDGRNATDLTNEEKWEKRSTFARIPRALLVRKILKGVLGRTKDEVGRLYNYGCWCGQRGHGIYVDNFDYCCKVHDFCEAELSKSVEKCQVPGGTTYMTKKFKYNQDTNTCAPLSEYTTRTVQEKQCRHAVCLCDMEMVRCMGHYKDEINEDNILHQQCTIRGDNSCKTKADVVFLIQDSQGISAATVQNIKTVLRRLLNTLGSETQDYNFALATYATNRRMSCFGSAEETTSYVDTEYHHGGSGRNLLNLALSEMILDQFKKRRNDRKGDDTAKILVIFSDGNAQHENGDIMDTYVLEKTAKVLRVDNNIKIIGAVIPNSDNTQRIQELKGIATEPDDALDVEFTTANLNSIADRLAARVRQLVCPVKYRVEIYTPDTHVNSEYRLTVRIKGQSGQKTAEHVLHGARQVQQGELRLIKSQFFDRDVGRVKRIEIKAKRTIGSVFNIQGWTLQEVKVKKGVETVTAVFREDIPIWPSNDHWYSARARRRPYVQYMVEIYGSPDTSPDDLFLRLLVRIIGKEQQTKNQLLTTRTQEVQGNRLVVKAQFTDVNVGSIKTIRIQPETRRNWTLNEVKVKTGTQTVTAEFNEDIEGWAQNWYFAPARASNPPMEE